MLESSATIPETSLSIRLGLAKRLHLYDGIPYRLFVDPMLRGVRDQVCDLIGGGVHVLDVGCGTGALAFQLAKRCCHVRGIDLSSAMIREAKRKRSNKAISNTSFIRADATKLSDIADDHYDWAVAALTLHSMPPELRCKTLAQMARVAKRILLADYKAPLPDSIWKHLETTIEALAGAEHHRNYQHYMKQGGLTPVIQHCGLEVVETIHHPKDLFEYVIVKGRG